MSRIGRKPIAIPSGVDVTLDNNVITVKGPKGDFDARTSQRHESIVEDDVITVERPSDNKLHRSLHGTTRSVIANMVSGVTKVQQEPGTGRCRLPRQQIGRQARPERRILPSGRNRTGQGHRIRSAVANEDHRERHRQGARRRNGRENPRRTQAGTVQGQRASSTKTNGLSARKVRPARRNKRLSRLAHRMRAAYVDKPKGVKPGMITKIDKNKARLKRHLRVRKKISGTAERPRLSVFRSAKHIYAQLIDDEKGVTLASASTLDKELRGQVEQRRQRRSRAQSRRTDRTSARKRKA